jgi:glutamine synthetase
MERLQKNSSQLPNSLSEALERLEIECRKAILEAMIKGIIPYRICKDNTTSTAIDKKQIGKSN